MEKKRNRKQGNQTGKNNKTIKPYISKNPTKGISTISGQETTYIKGLATNSFGHGGSAHNIDVRNGKIVRIRPLHYEVQYTPEEIGQFVNIPIEAVERAIELSETKYCSASEMLKKSAELVTEYEIRETK